MGEFSQVASNLSRISVAYTCTIRYGVNALLECDVIVVQETEVVIKDVQVKGGYIVHMGSVEGTIRVGDNMNLLVDTVSVAITQCIIIIDH